MLPGVAATETWSPRQGACHLNAIADNAEDFQSRPAIVIGGELNGLGVCRSLAMAGVPTFLLDRKRLNPAVWSRYTTSVTVGALQGQELLSALHRFHESLGGRPVLIVTDEMALLTISEARDQLIHHFRFRLPAPETVLMLHNKAQFHEYALANDLPVPNSEVIRDVTDIGRIQALRYPVIIKIADKRHFHSGDAPRLVVARDWGRAARSSRRLLAISGEIIVQECIGGPDSSIYFCLFYRGSGGATVIFSGRKLASCPPGAGSTALCMHAGEVSETLERSTRSFLERVDYSGFGGLEFKRDPASGRFVIIEPTVGRTDWQEEIATLSGVNIPLAGYRHEYELPQSLGEACISSSRIVWQASYIDRMRVGFGVVPSGAVVVDGYWRRDDPLPALTHYPRNMLISAPAIASAWSGRLAQRFGMTINRVCKRIRSA
jgi:D-aspartate ligase